MAEKLIISISGMRGIIGENMTAAIAAEYGSAFGTLLKRNCSKSPVRVCIGRDSRPSGQMVDSAVTAGLCAVGVDVVELGIVTTPCVGIMVRELDCCGGVVITASHNPIQYNGIKLLDSHGIAPSPQLANQIKHIFETKSFDYTPSQNCGKITVNDQTDAIHIAKVLAITDAKLVAAKKYKVVLDSVNGAGARVTKRLLDELGCHSTLINDEPTGFFAHTPEPTAANLTGLCDIVKEASYDIGFAQDPDADRLAIVDENGRYIGEEFTLALAAKLVFGKMKGPGAANLSTSRMIDDVAAKVGCEVIRTPVGEANVAHAMINNNCVIGGEGNGGVIDLRVGPVRDSLVGIAMVLQLMAETGKSIAELADEVGGYFMYKDKFKADASTALKVIEDSKKLFRNAKVNTSDGCRFDFEDGWIHLRTSNTEPVMRIICEAVNESAAMRYVHQIEQIVKAST